MSQQLKTWFIEQFSEIEKQIEEYEKKNNFDAKSAELRLLAELLKEQVQNEDSSNSLS